MTGRKVQSDIPRFELHSYKMGCIQYSIPQEVLLPAVVAAPGAAALAWHRYIALFLLPYCTQISRGQVQRHRNTRPWGGPGMYPSLLEEYSLWEHRAILKLKKKKKN